MPCRCPLSKAWSRALHGHVHQQNAKGKSACLCGLRAAACAATGLRSTAPLRGPHPGITHAHLVPHSGSSLQPNTGMNFSSTCGCLHADVTGHLVAAEAFSTLQLRVLGCCAAAASTRRWSTQRTRTLAPSWDAPARHLTAPGYATVSPPVHAQHL